MSNNTNGLAAIGGLLLLGVFIGLLIGNTGQPFEFGFMTKEGFGCRVSSNVALTAV